MTREEREKVVDALKISAPVMAVTQEEFNDYIQTLNKIMNWLEQEPRDDATLRDIFCMGCEYKEQEPELRQALEMEKGAYNALVKDLQCSDCISRQVVLDVIEDDNRNGHYSCFASNNDAECFKQIIRELPPATPTEKIGQWVTVDKGLIVTSYKCSECGRIVRDDTGYDVTKDYPYCHCGAKMEVE